MTKEGERSGFEGFDRLRLKIDIHVHTWYSDSEGSVGHIIEVARRKGLDGVAITDHHTLRGAREALSKKSGLIIVPGEEINTDRGDILALGIRKEIPERLPIAEAIAQVHRQNGLVVIPHPTIPLFSKIKESDLRRLPIDGLEVFSSISPLANYYATKNMEMAKRLKVPMLAGSDSHFPETVGDAYTIVDAKSCDAQGILDAIELGRTGIGCHPSKLIFKVKMLIGLATFSFRPRRGIPDYGCKYLF